MADFAANCCRDGLSICETFDFPYECAEDCGNSCMNFLNRTCGTSCDQNTIQEITQDCLAPDDDDSSGNDDVLDCLADCEESCTLWLESKCGSTCDTAVSTIMDAECVIIPTYAPLQTPTASPSIGPSQSPSEAPSEHPTRLPVPSPSITPSQTPSGAPSEFPTPRPTFSPTNAPQPGVVIIKPDGGAEVSEDGVISYTFSIKLETEPLSSVHIDFKSKFEQGEPFTFPFLSGEKHF